MANDRLQFLIDLAVEGGGESAAQIEAVQKQINAVTQDVAQFSQKGGFAAMGVGADKIADAEGQIQSLGKELLDVTQQAVSLQKQLAQTDPKVEPGQYTALQRDLIDTESRAASLRKELALLPRDLREGVADSVGYLGDIDSSLQAIGGTLRAFGDATGIGALGTIGGGLQLGGDAFATLEAIPRLQAGLSQLAANLNKVGVSLPAAGVGLGVLTAGMIAFNELVNASEKSVQGIIDAESDRLEILQVERQFSQLSVDQMQENIDARRADLQVLEESKGRLAANFLAQKGAIDDTADLFLTTAEAIGGVFGIGAFGKVTEELDKYNEKIAKQREELERLNAITEERAATSDVEKAARLAQELNELRQAGTSEEVQTRLDQLNAEQHLQQLILEDANQRLQSTQETINKVKAATGGAVSGDLLTRERELQAIYDETADKVADLNAEYNGLAGILPELIAQEERRANAIQLGTGALAALEAVREQEAEAIRKEQAALDELTSQRDQAAAALESVQDQIENLEQSRAEELATRQRFADLEAAQSAEIAQKQAQLELAQTAQIEAEKTEKIIDIREDAADKEADVMRDLAGDLQDIQGKANADLQKLQSDAIKQAQRAERDFYLERQRAIEDASRGLYEAVVDNDVNAFIARQQAAQTDISRRDQDFGISQGDFAEDTQDRAAEIRQQAEAEYIARQEAAAEQLVAIQTQQQQQIEAVVTGGQQTVTEVDRIQQELRALETQHSQERAALQLRIEEERYTRQLEMLQAQETALQKQLGELNSQSYVAALTLADSMVGGFLTAATDSINAYFAPLTGGQPIINMTVNANGLNQQEAQGMVLGAFEAFFG